MHAYITCTLSREMEKNEIRFRERSLIEGSESMVGCRLGWTHE